MARPPKYPLLPLLEHRDRRVDDATAELGDAVREREAAEQRKARAEAAEREAAERRAAIRREEAERLARGELRVADLARQEAWEVREKSEAAALSEATTSAASAAEQARGGEERARQGLADKKAERDVVAKDHDRFREQKKKVAEKAEEEAAEEAFRRGGRR